jgi:hypothetical protein
LELESSEEDLLPGQWRLTCRTGSTSTSLIQGDVEKGTLDIVVGSQSESAEINIRATSKTQNSLIKLETDGDLELVAGKNISLEGELIRLGEDGKTQPSILGNNWKEFMEGFISDLKQLKVTTPSGPGIPTPDFILLLEKRSLELDSNLSEVVEVQ